MELVVDIILAVLLIGAIGASWMVNKRLTIIREGQAELKTLVDDLNRVVGSAEASVAMLRQAAEEAEDKLKGETRRGRAMAEELSMIVEAGDNLANRLESRLTGPSAAKTATAETRGTDKEQEEILAALKEAR